MFLSPEKQIASFVLSLSLFIPFIVFLSFEFKVLSFLGFRVWGFFSLIHTSPPVHQSRSFILFGFMLELEKLKKLFEKGGIAMEKGEGCKDCGVTLGLFDPELCVDCDGENPQDYNNKKSHVYKYFLAKCPYCHNKGRGDCPEC